MADNNTRFAMEALKELDSGSIVAGYTGIGDASEYPATGFIVQNFTNARLTFSLNGIEDNIKLPEMGFWIEDVASNRQNNKGTRLPLGTRFYVKRDETPTSGSVCVTIIYAK